MTATQHKYPFNIAWSEEDGEYVATCGAFPGLSAFGETEEEALKEGKIALNLFIETCIDEGIELPDPQIAEDYSGQWRVRTAKSLHRRAAQMAELEGISLNQYTNYALSEKVVADESASKVQKKLDRALNTLATRPVLVTPLSGTGTDYSSRTIRTRIEETNDTTIGFVNGREH